MTEPKKTDRSPSMRESKGALLEAAQAAVADSRSRPPADHQPIRSSGVGRTVFQVIMVGIIGAGAAILITQPSWLVGAKLAPESRAVQTASATLSLVDAISKVKAFVDLRGRLPSRLDEAGVDNHAVRFKALEGTVFEVSVAAGDSVISIRSTDSLKPRVVDAILALQRRT